MVSVSKTKEDLRRSLPVLDGTLDVRGLKGKIRIFRDGYGIPHVKAENTHDAFFGQAFATAQDRLWHMDSDRRRAQGRWAELVGPLALAQDLMMRRFQIVSTVERDYKALDSGTREMLDAYAAGVNAYIDTLESLPVEYEIVDGKPESWQPWDCISVFKVRHIMMGVFEGKLWRAKLVKALGPEKAAGLLKGYQPGHLVIVPPGSTFEGPQLDGLEELSRNLETLDLLEDSEAGSNNWVLSGSRTASGKPLLAGDPHRALDTPNVYYQNHIACPEFDVVGLSFPGCPGFPHFGHNDKVAWCVTHAQADYQDIFIEKFNTDDGVSYEFEGERKPANVRREVIKVRGADSVEVELVSTHHGPIIAGGPSKGHGLAFRYTATADINLGMQSVRKMLDAGTTDQMDESMREWVDPCNNLLFADVQGNIAYLNRGQVPVRSMANAWLPVPGWTGEHEWQGNIPFKELPRSKNPDTGFIVTANNRIIGSDYPHYIALSYASEYRARRILDRLKGLDDATVDDMASIHAERTSIPALIFLDLIRDVQPEDDFAKQAKKLLSEWDGSMEKDEVAPTVFAAFRGKLLQKILSHRLGPLAEEMLSASGRGAPGHMQTLATEMNAAAQNNDLSILPPGEDWTSVIISALSEGFEDMRNEYGHDTNAWKWGLVHRTAPVHTLSGAFPELASLLDPPSVSMGGGLDTPQAAGHAPLGPYTIAGTSVARYVFDTSDWDNSRWIVPLGSSGHPGSTHYADQAETWANVGLIPMQYDWSKIEAAAMTKQVLGTRD